MVVATHCKSCVKNTEQEKIVLYFDNFVYYDELARQEWDWMVLYIS